jgi:hypothetical protein
MESNIQNTQATKAALWTGRIFTVVVVLFLLLDSVMKLFKPAFVVEANRQLGYPEHLIIPIAIALLVSVILYVIPATAVLGAILLTGYLGGAVATQVRVDAGAFPITFAVVLGILVWAGLFFREPRLQELLPLKR